MSSLAWRIKRLRAMRPQEVLFRFKQAAKMREELKREPSPVALRAAELLSTLPIPTETRPTRFFDFTFPYPEVTPDWHTDPKTGTTVSKDRWPDIDYRKADEIGSAKNIWELNRHQFLEEWAQDRTEDAALAVVRVILSWIADNQRPFGINWSSSLEPAFRMISWQRALEVLSKREVIDAAMPVIKSSVEEQCDHIIRFPSLFSSANNHRMGELTGALAGSNILGGTAWAASVLNDVKTEVGLQVTRDGVDREQAIFYHDYVLGFVQRVRHYTQSPFFDSHVDKMLEFSRWMRYSKNEWFEIGDRDDGIPMLDFDFIKPSGIKFWEDGGYAIWHGDQDSACFRAGPFGYPSIAAHAHCDQLSVILAADGEELLTDSGTYCYHEDEEMRKYFKGTSAHNTIRVDGLDQAEYGGPFLWSTHADGEISQIGENVFEGSHKGYLRLTGEVWHRRRVTFGGERLLAVSDRIDAKGNHDYELFWNLGPRCSVSTIGENGVEIECAGQRYRLSFTSDREIEVTLGEGSYSRKFGEMRPIPRIEVRTKAQVWTVTTNVERI